MAWHGVTMAIREQWDGGEWQQHCCRLLKMKYGEDVQLIPDRVRGDGGMEAYRLDDGVVYQCYAPKDAFTTRDQTDAQKGKIARDLYKLVSKPEETIAILGNGYRVRRWVLLTPEYDDKDVVKYARKKSEKIRIESRPVWCHEDFQVIVSSDQEQFPIEMASLYGIQAGSIRLDVPEPSVDEVHASVDEGLASRLTDKLSVNPILAANHDILVGYRSETLLDYVHGKTMLKLLEDRYSSAYEAVTRRSNSIFRSLNRRLASSCEPADLEHLTRQLANGFDQDVPGLPPVVCVALARHYVATWWVSCPMRFIRSTA
jgi:hypothetical protein